MFACVCFHIINEDLHKFVPPQNSISSQYLEEFTCIMRVSGPLKFSRHLSSPLYSLLSTTLTRLENKDPVLPRLGRGVREDSSTDTAFNKTAHLEPNYNSRNSNRVIPNVNIICGM